MPRYVNGLPVDSGASDSQDSARLAGMLAIAGIDNHCSAYMIDAGDSLLVGTRHPTDEFNGANNPNKFSRDQTMCLVAGLPSTLAYDLYAGAKRRGNRAQNWQEDDGSRKWYGADWLNPFEMEVLEMRAGYRRKLSLWARVIMLTELTLKRLFDSKGEPNQLIAKCYIANELPTLKRLWPTWREAINDYWCGWRGEPELAAKLIERIEREA